jgi:hypothetical protein
VDDWNWQPGEPRAPWAAGLFLSEEIVMAQQKGMKRAEKVMKRKRRMTRDKHAVNLKKLEKKATAAKSEKKE